MVGFGAQEAGASSGDRRQGTARVRAIDAATFEVDAAPSLTCQGDSGGPALRRLGEREVIAGVTSDGDAACARFSAFARVDVDVERFLAPILAAGPKEPTRALPLDALCTTACASDHDCPSALWCAAASSQGARCVGPGGVHARYGVECDDDGDCIAGTCAPVVEGERETCRCREICPRSDAGPSLSGGGGGCAHSAAARSGATSLLLIGALAALRARSFTSRRRLRRAPRR
ncbi:MAG: trypsin-like serine protease [Deltaproteobacteria bacterium]|nr:trypsin-like serine protease [Deltaproteobacteria bacterium]